MDIQDTLLTGFAVSNPQHNFNSPTFGLDNWIYLSNEPATTAKVYTEEFSDPGSEVRHFNKPGGPVLPPNGGGRRVRLKPDELKLEAMSNASQFGQTLDQWGRHFLVSNANHIFHEVIRETYLKRNPDLLIPRTTVVISDHGPAAEVYPIIQHSEYQLLTDPAVFTASRLYEQNEFLASTDPCFRPVNPYFFPDGMGNNGSDFTVGAVLLKSGMGNFLKGQIGGLAAFDRALSEEEIASLHKS